MKAPLDQQRFLISKFNRIGDALLSTPVLENIKKYNPSSFITYATYDFNADILKHNPCIDQLLLFPSSSKGVTRAIQNLKFFSSFLFNRQDVYICLRDASRSRPLGRLSRAPIRIAHVGSHSSPSSQSYTHQITEQKGHAVLRDLETLKPLDIPISTTQPRIYWNQEDLNHMEQVLPQKPFIQLHPFTRVQYKEIPLHTLNQLCQAIFSEGYLIVLTGGPSQDEHEKRKALKEICPIGFIDFGGQLSLNQLALLSQKAEIYLGADTAAMHLAASQSTPVVSWFGPSIQDQWGPWDHEHQVVGNNPLSPHQIISMDLPCLPCDQQGCNNSGISDCLENLNSDIIIETTLRTLKKLKDSR